MNINFGMSRSEFSGLYLEKKPLLVKGAIDPVKLSWKRANRIFEKGDVSSDDFKLAFYGIRPKSEYVESYWDVGIEK